MKTRVLINFKKKQIKKSDKIRASNFGARINKYKKLNLKAL